MNTLRGTYRKKTECAKEEKKQIIVSRKIVVHLFNDTNTCILPVTCSVAALLPVRFPQTIKHLFLLKIFYSVCGRNLFVFIDTDLRTVHVKQASIFRRLFFSKD